MVFVVSTRFESNSPCFADRKGVGGKMQLFARVAAVLLLSAGVLAENNSTTKWPEVVGVMIVPKSLEDHHTDKYGHSLSLTSKSK
jgi:hypothetical protein